MTNKQKLYVASIMLKTAKEQLNEAHDLLKQAEDDWCILHSCDGDRSKVKQLPIFSVNEGLVSVDCAIEAVSKIEELLKE